MADRKDDFRDDFYAVPRAEWVPVLIPAEDLMGREFPNPRINGYVFEAGKEHMVPPSYAETLSQIISRVNKDASRLLRPTIDVESLKQATGGNADKNIKYAPVV